MTEARERTTLAEGVAHAGILHNDMANAIRALAMDAVQAAKSGHPGMPMGMADVATVLFREALRFDASDPKWPNRDRLILSAGHGSMLLYALLYLTGYPGMDIGELKRFRQMGAKTAGHPEYGHAPGIETTTGPLGQGLANAVGMAIAERMLNARLGSDVIDHHIYAIAGDGCLMEGISHEAISLAGHLGLGKLIVLFDDNGISIDGPTALAVSDDQAMRFKASGWNTVTIDGHDPKAISAALSEARADASKPWLIACKTTIGYGAPTKAGKSSTHGEPLGEDEIKGAREKLRLALPAVRDPRARAARLARARPEGRQGAVELEGEHGKGTGCYRAGFTCGCLAPRRYRPGDRASEGSVRRRREQTRDPRMVADGARRAHPRAAGADRRLGRPDGLQRHPHQVRAHADRQG